MNFDLTADQTMMRESFARFLDEHSAIAKVRAAAAGSGFDAEMWHGLAELGALAIRVPEASGGLGLGLVDAGVLMEEAGRSSRVLWPKRWWLRGCWQNWAVIQTCSVARWRVKRSSRWHSATLRPNRFNGSPAARWPRQ
jgi:hypothetical protein